MIVFDQLRISDDGKQMFIDLHVNQAEGLENIYLKELIIATRDQVSKVSPTIPSEYVHKIIFSESQKEAHLILSPVDLEGYGKSNFSEELFFVYVSWKGTHNLTCLPCEMEREYTLGVTFDEALLHQQVMGYTKGLQQRCQIPVGFTDFILLWNAFKSAIETEHYVPAIDFWEKLFGKGSYIGATNGTIKNCGCHG